MVLIWPPDSMGKFLLISWLLFEVYERKHQQKHADIDLYSI